MRNMTKRRMLMVSSSHHSRLPVEYQEVEWLRGSTTQFCTTAYSPQSYPPTVTELYGDITVLDINSARFAFGLTWSDDVQYSFGIVVSSGKIYFYYGNSSSDQQSFNLNTLGTVPIDIHFILKADKIIINNSTFSREVQLFDTPDNKMLIGKMSSNGTVQNTQIRIKHLAIYNRLNGKLITDIIPCYRISDGKAGFYQTNVPEGEEHFITNQATGNDWVIGPVVT